MHAYLPGSVTDTLWVTAIRLIAASAVLVAPLPAFWISGHLDRWDWAWLDMPAVSGNRQDVYQYWDKVLDTYTLAMATVVALRWKDPVTRRLALATSGWRVAGVFIFMISGQPAALVIFPNVFERLFLFYLVFRMLSRHDLMLRSRTDATLTMVALTLPKLAEEYFIHIGTRPWQTLTLLPSPVSTPDREYWVWAPIMLALPVLAMGRLLLAQRKPILSSDALSAASIPLVSAFLGRQAHDQR